MIDHPAAGENDGTGEEVRGGIRFKHGFDWRRHSVLVPSTVGQSGATDTRPGTRSGDTSSDGSAAVPWKVAAPSAGANDHAVGISDTDFEKDALDEFLGSDLNNFEEEDSMLDALSAHKQPLAGEVGQSPPVVNPGGESSNKNTDESVCYQGSVSTTMATHPAHQELLERVQLAHNLVVTSLTLQTIPPSSEEQSRYPSDAFVDEDEGKTKSLRTLGLELYELFAGSRPSVSGRATIDGNTSCTDQDDVYYHDRSNSWHQPRKRRDENRHQQEYSPLSDLGLPSSLSWMVDILISGGNADCDEGKLCYRSEKEVELDLKLMIDCPDIFLYSAADAESIVSGEVHAHHHLLIPDKLYGREEYGVQLRDAYDRASHSGGQCQAVFVFGEAGVGKSSLIRSVLESYPAVGRRHVVYAKFDELVYSQSVSVIFHAFDEYCARLVATEPASRLDELGAAMLNAIDREGRKLLFSLMPRLRWIISDGSSPDTIGLGTNSFENQGAGAHFRLRFAVRVFLQTLASWVSECGTALTIFIDDLQFADHNSHDLVTVLLTDTALSGVLFLGGYRTGWENDTSSGSDLTILLGLLRDAEMIQFTDIHITNIGKNCVNTLVAESIRIIPRLTRPFSDVIFHRTNGNPLFVRQLLQSLVSEQRLVYSVSLRRWTWDLESIQRRPIDNNVLALMIDKINKLSSEVRLALTMASALGFQCSKSTVSLLEVVREEGNLALSDFLDAAVDEGLMDETKSSYRWTHDRVQEAAYSLLSQKEEREAMHFLIGLQLRRALSQASPVSPSSADDLLFLTVDHMCRGISLIQAYDDKIDLALLCLRAGKKSVLRSSFPSALIYFKAGRSLLDEDDWTRNYDLMHDLTNSCAEMEYTAGDIASMKPLLNDSLAHSISFDDKIRCYITLISSLCANDNPKDAVKVILEVLERVGETFPSTVEPATVFDGLQETQRALADTSHDSLKSLPEMKDKQKALAMSFLNQLHISSYMAGMHNLTALTIFRMVCLSMVYGLCSESPSAFAWYGYFLCSGGASKGCAVHHDIEKGYRYGKAGMALSQRFDPRQSIRVSVAFYGSIAFYKEPLQALIEPLEAAYEASMMAGDLYAGGLCSFFACQYSLFCGKNLEDLLRKMTRNIKSLGERKQTAMLAFQVIDKQCVLNLTGRSEDPTKLKGESVDIDEMEAKMLWPLVSLACSYQVWISYLFGKYEMAVQYAEKKKNTDEEYLNGLKVFSRWVRCVYVFYDGLASLALSRKSLDPTLTQRSKDAIDTMKTWAKLAPWNFEHKLELLLAEQAFAAGNYDAAFRSYDNGVNLAEKRGFVDEAAVAAECAFIFFNERGDYGLAEVYRSRAVELYGKWGATAKVTRLRLS